MSTEAGKPVVTDHVAAGCRLFLGGLLVYMGVVKAMDPIAFLTTVREYQVVQNHLLLNAIASLLPWFEVFCGLLLLGGVAVRGTSLVVLALLFPFTLLVVQRAWGIHNLEGIPFCAVKFDCGCGNGEVRICRKIVENGVLMALGLWLMFRPRGRFCLRFGLWRTGERLSSVST